MTDAPERIWLDWEGPHEADHSFQLEPYSFDCKSQHEYVRADAAPRVKPLVWDNETRHGKRVHAAGDYTIVEHHPDGHVRFSILYRGLRKDKTYYRTIEAAKAAAQSDYERRIISALEGQP